MAKFNVEYSMVRFCQDLTWIRDNTIKKSTILSAFEKSGMYPVDASQCIAQLRKFVPSIMETKNRKNEGSLSASLSAGLSEPNLPRIQTQNVARCGVRSGSMEIKNRCKYAVERSCPRRRVESYVSNTRQIIAESEFKDYELSLHQKRRHDELMQKSASRKRLKPTHGGMGVTKEDALVAIAEKRRKEDELI